MSPRKITTIGIHLATKKTLLKIAAEFSIPRGVTYSYDKTIQALIKEHEERQENLSESGEERTH